MISDNRSMESMLSIKEQQLPSFKVENAEVTHLKPSQLPLMNQVNILVVISDDLLSIYSIILKHLITRNMIQIWIKSRKV